MLLTPDPSKEPGSKEILRELKFIKDALQELGIYKDLTDYKKIFVENDGKLKLVDFSEVSFKYDKFMNLFNMSEDEEKLLKYRIKVSGLFPEEKIFSK